MFTIEGSKVPVRNGWDLDGKKWLEAIDLFPSAEPAEGTEAVLDSSWQVLRKIEQHRDENSLRDNYSYGDAIQRVYDLDEDSCSMDMATVRRANVPV
jgi:hypothetical protein